MGPGRMTRLRRYLANSDGPWGRRYEIRIMRGGGGCLAFLGEWTPRRRPRWWGLGAPAFALRPGSCAPLRVSLRLPQVSLPLEGGAERGRSPPGTRASRPQPYSSQEVTKRQRDVAGRQAPFRREPQRQGARSPTAPPQVDVNGGDGQGSAGKMCGRDARAPGWASTLN